MSREFIEVHIGSKFGRNPGSHRAAIAKSNRLVEQRLYRKDNYGGASGNW